MSAEIIPDRPWATREYGRLRLNEGFADELLEVLNTELDVLHSAREIRKEHGENVLTDLNRRIRRLNAIRALLMGMMREKGWLVD